MRRSFERLRLASLFKQSWGGGGGSGFWSKQNMGLLNFTLIKYSGGKTNFINVFVKLSIFSHSVLVCGQPPLSRANSKFAKSNLETPFSVPQKQRQSKLTLKFPKHVSWPWLSRCGPWGPYDCIFCWNVLLLRYIGEISGCWNIFGNNSLLFPPLLANPCLSALKIRRAEFCNLALRLWVFMFHFLSFD